MWSPQIRNGAELWSEEEDLEEMGEANSSDHSAKFKSPAPPPLQGKHILSFWVLLLVSTLSSLILGKQ